jgi:nucleoside 2-deoxyribosyltransferase
MRKPKIYLAGSMAGRVTKEVLAERKKASRLCRQMGMAPLDPGYTEAKDWTGYRISDTMSLKKMKKYVDKDLKLIRRADGLIKLTGDKASDGTDFEKDYAKFIGIPVAIVSSARFSGKLMGFSNVLFPVFPTMKQAFKYLKKELK